VFGWRRSPVVRSLRWPRDLGVHPEALRKRVRRAQADAGERGDVLSTAERKEIKRLRREVFELRRANSILKEAPRRPTQTVRRECVH
jgi:transposase-like protein